MGKNQNWLTIDCSLNWQMYNFNLPKDRVSFGSISGYVGYYDFDKKKTTYFEAINDELIRGVHLL